MKQARQSLEPHVKTIIRRAGGPSAVARACGNISRQAVSKWRHVPPRWVETVAMLAGTTPQKIRPDVFHSVARKGRPAA